MAHTDPIADVLTRIRNASRAHHETVEVPYAKLHESLINIIINEGFLGTSEVVGEGVNKALRVSLKYTADQRSVLTDMQRVSKPGRRMYVGHKEVKKVRGGLGIAVLSTPKGLMSDAQAREQKVGGEVLCSVW